MILSIMDTMSVYYMSLFRIPRGVANIIEKIMRDFLWDGADGKSHSHLVAWDTVVKPKEVAGLGIGYIYLRNKALLSKW